MPNLKITPRLKVYLPENILVPPMAKLNSNNDDDDDDDDDKDNSICIAPRCRGAGK